MPSSMGLVNKIVNKMSYFLFFIPENLHMLEFFRTFANELVRYFERQYIEMKFKTQNHKS